MESETSPFVVTPDWIAARRDDETLKIVDASWYLPAQNRDPKAEYDTAHIPGAVFFDQDDIVDPDSDLPHALPSPEVFAEKVGALGISASDTVVVYDGIGMFSAPRVWWMFRAMGVKQAYVLDGGFDAWKAEGYPVKSEPPSFEPVEFTPNFNEAAVASLADMKSFVENGASQIADARPAGRFTGDEPEPRAGMRSGHMPGAHSVPAVSLSHGGKLKDLDSLRAIFDDAGVDLDKPVATSCGSGVTAAVITLALQSLGHTDNKLYDGSWAEWSTRPDTPVETGPSHAMRPETRKS